MAEKHKFLNLIEICKGHTVYIQTHNYPDPDAISSAFGLQELLRHFGVDSTMVYEGRMERLSTLKMLDLFNIEISIYDEVIDTMDETDYIICVDSQKLNGNITDFKGNEIAAIDHHPTYAEIEYLYKDIRRVGACATIITDYYRKLGIEPSKEVATALAYGIRMDTLQFSRGVTIHDLHAYEFLFPLMSKRRLKSLESDNMSFEDLKAYGTSIENIKVFSGIAFSFLPFDCPDAMIAILSDFMLSLVEVKVAILYSKRRNGWKFSIRSEVEEVDAGTVIHEALSDIGSGGGHPQMAGGFVPIEAINKLGPEADAIIRERFLERM